MCLLSLHSKKARDLRRRLSEKIKKEIVEPIQLIFCINPIKKPNIHISIIIEESIRKVIPKVLSFFLIALILQANAKDANTITISDIIILRKVTSTGIKKVSKKPTVEITKKVINTPLLYAILYLILTYF